MSSAMARGSATQPPELTPERAVLLKVKAFALDQVRALGVSPQRESGAAPPLAVSRDGAAETLSRSQNTETGLPARVHIGDEVSPLTNDTSIPVSTENSGSLHSRPHCTDYCSAENGAEGIALPHRVRRLQPPSWQRFIRPRQRVRPARYPPSAPSCARTHAVCTIMSASATHLPTLHAWWARAPAHACRPPRRFPTVAAVCAAASRRMGCARPTTCTIHSFRVRS